jgi:hypothetical protein
MPPNGLRPGESAIVFTRLKRELTLRLICQLRSRENELPVRMMFLTLAIAKISSLESWVQLQAMFCDLGAIGAPRASRDCVNNARDHAFMKAEISALLQK